MNMKYLDFCRQFGELAPTYSVEYKGFPAHDALADEQIAPLESAIMQAVDIGDVGLLQNAWTTTSIAITKLLGLLSGIESRIDRAKQQADVAETADA